MKKRKWLIYLITISAMSIVVFNNFTDLLNKLFKPSFNLLFFLSFGIIVGGTIWYIVLNWNNKEK